MKLLMSVMVGPMIVAVNLSVRTSIGRRIAGGDAWSFEVESSLAAGTAD